MNFGGWQRQPSCCPLSGIVTIEKIYFKNLYLIISFHQTISESKTHFKTHICWFDYNVEACNTTKDRHTIKENRKQKENDRVKANPEKRTRNTELKKKKQEEGDKHINTTITFNVLCSSAMNHILFFSIALLSI